MWKVAGRVSAVRSTSSLNSNRYGGSSCIVTCPLRFQHSSAATTQTPPMSQPLQNRDREQSIPPPPPPPPRKSNAGKYLGFAVGGVLVGTGIVLGIDENSRIAAVETFPALQSVFDTLGLSTTSSKKSLPPAPLHTAKQQAADNMNVLSIAEKSVNQMKTPVETKSLTQAASSENKRSVQASPAPASPSPASKQPVKLSLSDTSVPREAGALITTIAEDSVRLLMSGKRTPEELEAQERCRREKELALLAAENKRRDNAVRSEMEKRDADALASIAKKQRELTEEEKAKELERLMREKNAEIEHRLSKGIGSILDSADKAVCSNKCALEACRMHSSELKKAMEAEKDTDAQQYWSKLCEYRELRTERVTQAHAAIDAALKQVADYISVVKQAKGDELTKSNPALNSYLTQAKKICSDLEQTKASLDSAETMEQVMKYYFDLMQRDRANFEEDLREHLPDVKPGSKGEKLTQEELSALLTHAHQRIFQLKKKLRENEVLEQQRLEDALREQKEMTHQHYESQLKQQLSDQKSKVDAEANSQLLAHTSELERQLREELARQALAHNNHLADMLKLQQGELMNQFERQLTDRIGFERATYVDSLAKHIAKIDGLSAALEEKADVSATLDGVQRLMSSAQCFMYTLAKTDSEVRSDEEYSVISLTDALKQCEAVGHESAFIRTVLDSIPDQARRVGVYTELALEKRFDSVMAQCKKVALYPTANNIVSQTLSTAYSKLVLNSAKPKYTNVTDFESCEGMDVRDLLVQAQYFMNKKCLDGAVKCMVQLEGIPRSLAQGWIDEARLVLEVRQAAEALYAYALSNSMGFII